jgi:hypothetical protein
MRTVVSGMVTPCSLVGGYQRFGIYRLHLQGSSHNQKDHIQHFHRRENLKFHMNLHDYYWSYSGLSLWKFLNYINFEFLGFQTISFIPLTGTESHFHILNKEQRRVSFTPYYFSALQI